MCFGGLRGARARALVASQPATASAAYRRGPEAGSHAFAEYHHHHPAVFGMVRDYHGLVEVNTNHGLTTPEMEIIVHGSPTLHAFDFIL
jgi:hypothetical protein